MSSTPLNPDDCLALAKQSPAAVAAKDKTAWVNLFAPGAVVEDPYGSAPHTHQPKQGDAGPIPCFYETFIAPNKIVFHVDNDVVCDNTVVRDLTIEIRMTEKVIVHAPMHLRYHITQHDGQLKLQHLAAHWELMPMLKLQMSYGLASLAVGTRLFIGMIKHLGFSGIAGFAKARHTVGERGKSKVWQFEAALRCGNRDTLKGLLSDQATIEWPAGQVVNADQWELPTDIRLSKLLAAGDTISATVESAGKQGVAFFRFDDKRRIASVRYYA